MDKHSSILMKRWYRERRPGRKVTATVERWAQTCNCCTCWTWFEIGRGVRRGQLAHCKLCTVRGVCTAVYVQLFIAPVVSMYAERSLTKKRLAVTYAGNRPSQYRGTFCEKCIGEHCKTDTPWRGWCWRVQPRVRLVILTMRKKR